MLFNQLLRRCGFFRVGISAQYQSPCVHNLPGGVSADFSGDPFGELFRHT